MIGAVASNFSEAIEITQYIASLSAGAVIILSPPGLHPEPEKIYNFYKWVSEKITLPVAIYNSPGNSGVDITPESMSGIAEPPRMEYMKESAYIIVWSFGITAISWHSKSIPYFA